MAKNFMEKCETLEKLDVEHFAKGKTHRFKLKISGDQLGDAVYVPIILIRGESEGPRVVVAAATHGFGVDNPCLFVALLGAAQCLV